MFGWFRNRRRRKLLGETVDRETFSTIECSLRQFPFLDSPQKQQLIDTCRIIVAEKHWEGCKGLVLNQTMKLGIAAQAALMLLGFPGEYFDWVETILVYPDTYVVEEPLFSTGSSTMVVGAEAREGQTSYRGPVILNWSSIEDEVFGHVTQGRIDNHQLAEQSARNLVIHEFSHQLDMAGDGIADGIPPLGRHINSKSWRTKFLQAYESEHAKADRRSPFMLDDYALTSPVEYFAVASEAYFQVPHELGHYYVETFNLLRDFYRIDLRSQLPRL